MKTILLLIVVVLSSCASTGSNFGYRGGETMARGYYPKYVKINVGKVLLFDAQIVKKR